MGIKCPHLILGVLLPKNSWGEKRSPSVLPGAGVVCLLVKEGVVFRALRRREPDDHAHYYQKDMRVLFDRTGMIDLV